MTDENRSIDQKDQVVEKKSQSAMHRYWFFTWNNYTDPDGLAPILRTECDWYIYQEEKGVQGTPHLQGTLCLKTRQRLTSLKKIHPAIHWEPTRHVKQTVEYCTKEATRIGKQWIHGIDGCAQVHTSKPYGWQLDVMHIVGRDPDDRTIHWFWEPNGNVGKTSLCKYLVVHHDALMLSGKSNDMFHMLAQFPNKRKLILVDIPRSSQDFINYGAIEMIKNGLIFSGKYEGAQLVFNSPHLIVFANAPPDYTKLSGDRWNVVRI